MIENIRTIAKIMRENNASVNNPYNDGENFKVLFGNDNEIWLYIDTLWKYEYKKHVRILKKVFMAKEVLYVGQMTKDDKPFWAVRLK